MLIYQRVIHIRPHVTSGFSIVDSQGGSWRAPLLLFARFAHQAMEVDQASISKHRGLYRLEAENNG